MSAHHDLVHFNLATAKHPMDHPGPGLEQRVTGSARLRIATISASRSARSSLAAMMSFPLAPS
jgi:hypothetical protein